MTWSTVNARVRGIKDGGFTRFISSNSCAFEVIEETTIRAYFHYSYFKIFQERSFISGEVSNVLIVNNLYWENFKL